MADREDGVLAVEEGSGEIDHPLICAEVVRRVAAGKEERVELIRLDLVDAALGADDFLAVLAGQLGVLVEPNDHHLMSGGLERVIRLAEFGVLEVVVEQAGDSHCRSPRVPLWITLLKSV